MSLPAIGTHGIYHSTSTDISMRGWQPTMPGVVCGTDETGPTPWCKCGLFEMNGNGIVYVEISSIGTGEGEFEIES